MQSYRIRRDGTELILLDNPEGLPQVVHWGAPLGPVTDTDLAAANQRGVSYSALDKAWPLTVLPTDRDGWQGRPALVARSGDRILDQQWTDVAVSATEHEITVRAALAPQFSLPDDASPALSLELRYTVNTAGVVEVFQQVTNTGSAQVEVGALEAVLPVGDVAAEVLDFSGRWIRERAPQRAVFTEGSRVRETRRGRTGHDSPMVLAAGTAGFNSAQGTIWAVHLGWSADAVYRQDRLPEARPLIGAGPLLRAGEVSLAPGESFAAPINYFAWSDAGLDGIGDRFQRTLRASRTTPLPTRPVTLNVWEAVYFNHDLSKLKELARVGAGIGVERFVLDDGWFLGRRSDNAGLGDWQVDPNVWPQGLGPLADYVRELGMEFGLWFEPEMVNPDSELARNHPDWVLGPALGQGVVVPRTWRNQYVLDLSRPQVRDYLFDAMSTLVTEYGIAYIKWDQNRDLLNSEVAGQARVVAHTRGAYELLARLKAAHPDLEIESCASGGGRIDFGVLAYTDRVWASDTNDPIERLDLQRWTELLLPPEFIGSHVGPEVAHTTWRHTDLSFRIATGLMNSFGIETDITRCSEEELAQYAQGIAAYKRLRGLLHSGRQHHINTPDPGIRATITVDDDATAAVLRIARVASDSRALPAAVPVPGLNPDTIYLVRPLPELAPPKYHSVGLPGWLAAKEFRASGALLAHFGLRLPQLTPAQAMVLEITAV